MDKNFPDRSLAQAFPVESIRFMPGASICMRDDENLGQYVTGPVIVRHSLDKCGILHSNGFELSYKKGVDPCLNFPECGHTISCANFNLLLDPDLIQQWLINEWTMRFKSDYDYRHYVEIGKPNFRPEKWGVLMSIAGREQLKGIFRGN